RGQLEGTEIQGSTQMIRASVPLSDMFGYATELRSRTQGRGSFTMHFSRYEQVPKSISEEIVASAHGKVTEQDSEGGWCQMGKEKFDRSKPHVNIGTMG